MCHLIIIEPRALIFIKQFASAHQLRRNESIVNNQQLLNANAGSEQAAQQSISAAAASVYAASIDKFYFDGHRAQLGDH